MATFNIRNIRNKVRENVLLLLIIAGVLLGFILGVSLNGRIQSDRYSKDERRMIVMVISFLGDIFIRLLKLLIVPLIVTSIVMAVASLDTKTTGKLGRRTLIYYLCTTFIAVGIGIILVVSIRPGDKAVKHEQEQQRHVDALDSILDLFRNLFPDNLMEAAFRSSSTTYKDQVTSIKNQTRNIKHVKDTVKNLSDFLENTIYDPWSVQNDSDTVRVITKQSKAVWAGVKKTERTNVLGLILCSIAFGIALSRLGEQGKILLEIFDVLMKVVMSLVNAVMWTSPIGICSLIAGKLVEMEDIGETFASLAYFMVTVIVAIALQALIVYPLIYFIFLRKNPFKYIFGLQPAIFTAFGTDSSAATLPVTLKCVKEVNKVDERVAHFVLPIGATVNMDGTALYEAIACIYIAQLNGFGFGIAKILITCLTAAAASIGAAAIPSAGLVTLLMVLEAAGLPTGDVGLLYSIDWFLDRFRTVCNVMGDAFGAAVVERFSRNELSTDMQFEETAMNERYISKEEDLLGESHENKSAQVLNGGTAT